MSSVLSASMGVLPLERCWMVLEQQESLPKKKKGRATELSDAIGCLLFVIYRMNAPQPPRIPKCERVRYAGLRSEGEQAWERVDTNDWVKFVSFVHSFYFPDPCDRLKKKNRITGLMEHTLDPPLSKMCGLHISK